MKAPREASLIGRFQGGKSFNHKISGVVQPKSADQYQVVGSSRKRMDLLKKVTGTFTYVQDLNFENLVHARVVETSDV